MTRVTVTRRLRRTVLALLILVLGAAGVVAQPQGGAPVAANAPPAVAPATPAFATARDLMKKHRVPVVVEFILERVTNIAMGTEIDNIVEFEETLDLPLDEVGSGREVLLPV